MLPRHLGIVWLKTSNYKIKHHIDEVQIHARQFKKTQDKKIYQWVLELFRFMTSTVFTNMYEIKN